MRARTNFIRIDNDLGSSRKVLELRDELALPAIGLLVLAIGYADRQRTDGAISKSAMRRGVALGLPTEELIAELVRVRFLEETGDGYSIVGYLEWQRSAEEIDAALEQRREAGRRSAEERAKRAAESKGQDLKTTPTDKRREDKRSVGISLSEPFNGSLSEPLDPAANEIREAARSLSRRSSKPVTPADVTATIAKAAPDAMPSEIRRAVDLVASDGSVRVPLSIFAIRLKEARAAREAF